MHIASQQAQTYMETWCTAILLKNRSTIVVILSLCEGDVAARGIVGMWESGGATRMCDLSAGWRRVVSFTPRLGEGVSGIH